MPRVFEKLKCTDCQVEVHTPRKRKCRLHRMGIKNTRPRATNVPLTRRVLGELQSNIPSSLQQTPLQSNTFFASSIWRQPTPPSHSHDHTLSLLSLSSEPSPPVRHHKRSFSVFQDEARSPTSSPNSLPSTQFSQSIASQENRSSQRSYRPTPQASQGIARSQESDPQYVSLHHSPNTLLNRFLNDESRTSADQYEQENNQAQRPESSEDLVQSNLQRQASQSIPEPFNDTVQLPPQALFRRPTAWISQFSPRVEAHSLGLMNIECSHCHALHWRAEAGKGACLKNLESPKFEHCCKKGAINVEVLENPPRYLKALFEHRHSDHQDFHKKIRSINASLAMVSVDMKPNDRMTNTTGLRTFQLQGSIHHLHNPSHNQPGAQPSYAQLYFLSPGDATTVRQARNPHLSPDLLNLLTQQFDRHNSYSRLYKRAAEALENATSQQSQDQVTLNREFTFQLQAGRDKNRENLPSTYEVAAIIPNLAEQNWDPERREVIRVHRDPHEIRMATRPGYRPPQSPLERISRRHPAYFPMAYPLLFPWGGPIYHQEVVLNRENRVRNSPCAEPRQFFFSRPNSFNLFLRAGQLLQQFAVDVFACIDQDRLAFLRANQKALRADKYAHIQQHLQDGVDPNRIGKRTVLPSSYTCGPRYMAQRYQDAITLVRHYSKPDLFITFTANPKWPEIQENLLPGQAANDRPDLIVRVTRQKFQAFLDEILKQEIFGKVNGHVYTTEYQKRGLPHFHLLLFLKQDEPSYQAELPSPEIDPDGSLAKIVRSCMLHRECGANHRNAPCMRNGSCEKRFPKPFRQATSIGTGGYPDYRRRHNTPYILDGQVQLTGDLNSRVVPYNPYLTRRYSCHINVELCADVNAIRYIFKYIFKGHDLTNVTITERNENPQHPQDPQNARNPRNSRQPQPNQDPTHGAGQTDHLDEITLYLNCRYLSSCEALWRLFEYPVLGQTPSVLALDLHLPQENPILWEEGLTSQELREKADEKASMLMGFFQWNLEQERLALAQGRPYDRDAQDLYLNFPQNHVWVAKHRKWKLRQKKFQLGRIQNATPNQGERWFLRRLITMVRGPTSFEDLRTVDGVLHSTFREACLALRLVEDDNEWDACFEEARTWQVGSGLRALFVTALEHGPPVNSWALWNRFRPWICDDLPRQLERWRAQGLLTATPNEDSELHYDLGLYEIRKRLREQGRDLLDFGLPLPQHPWERHIGNPLIQRERNYDPEHEQSSIDQLRQRLNEEQQTAFDTITTRLERTPTECQFFIQGPAGTGKTFLYHCLCHYLRAQGKIVLCVASSGIAALLLPGGTTAHSRFKIPLTINGSSNCDIPATGQLAALLRETALIIWDEAPMTNRYCYDAVDRSLQDICDKPGVPFGGIPVVLGGDFAQILPVVEGANRSATVDASLQRSLIWQHCTLKRLTQNMRLQTGTNNQSFAEWIRTMSYQEETRGVIQLPSYISRATDEEDLISTIYPAFPVNHEQQLEFYRDRALLATVNNVIDTYNQRVTEQFLRACPGPPPRCFYAIDTLDTDKDSEFDVDTEYLNTLTPDGLPPFELKLKPGLPIMLLRNIDSSRGLANGSRLILTRIHHYVLEGRLLGGDFHGQARIIPRIKLTTKADHFPLFSRKQFPVKICFAMTIHKSQGQSLRNVGVDLRRPCFTHGQLYVALSRVTDVSRLKVLLNPPNDAYDLNDAHNLNDAHDPNDVHDPHNVHEPNDAYDLNDAHDDLSDTLHDRTENVVYPEALLI